MEYFVLILLKKNFYKINLLISKFKNIFKYKSGINLCLYYNIYFFNITSINFQIFVDVMILENTFFFLFFNQLTFKQNLNLVWAKYTILNSYLH
jgi:hypothetical protein